MTSGTIFEDHVCEVFEDIYNENTVHFCSEARHKACCKVKECELCRPTCEVAVRRFLGLTYTGMRGISITERDKKIHAKLYRIWKKCRAVEVTARRMK
jgi:hypothetical protein